MQVLGMVLDLPLLLCDFGQLTWALEASASSSVQWG